MRLSDRKSKFFISFKTSIHKVSFNTLISVTGAVFLSANLIFYLSSLCASLYRIDYSLAPHGFFYRLVSMSLPPL